LKKEIAYSNAQVVFGQIGSLNPTLPRILLIKGAHRTNAKTGTTKAKIRLKRIAIAVNVGTTMTFRSFSRKSSLARHGITESRRYL